jgi:hypothetical protein
MKKRANSSDPPTPHQAARLIRHNRVRVLNCSAGGCLLETTHRLAVNNVAALQVSFGGKVFEDVVRVVRCESIVARNNIYHMAVMFLSVTPAYAGSLRCLMRQEISDLAGWLNHVGTTDLER